jgi:hypothetical protein
MDANIGSQASLGPKRKPAGDVLLLKRECFSSEENEWIENRAPGESVSVGDVIEMARSYGIFGQN